MQNLASLPGKEAYPLAKRAGYVAVSLRETNSRAANSARKAESCFTAGRQGLSAREASGLLRPLMLLCSSVLFFGNCCQQRGCKKTTEILFRDIALRKRAITLRPGAECL
jgi:hypothetical protein